MVAGKSSKEVTFSRELLLLGQNAAATIPANVARSYGFRPGAFVRVVLLPNEIRIRPASSPRLYDLETLDEYRERRSREEAEKEEAEANDAEMRGSDSIRR